MAQLEAILGKLEQRAAGMAERGGLPLADRRAGGVGGGGRGWGFDVGEGQRLCLLSAGQGRDLLARRIASWPANARRAARCLSGTLRIARPCLQCSANVAADSEAPDCLSFLLLLYWDAA